MNLVRYAWGRFGHPHPPVESRSATPALPHGGRASHQPGLFVGGINRCVARERRSPTRNSRRTSSRARLDFCGSRGKAARGAGGERAARRTGGACLEARISAIQICPSPGCTVSGARRDPRVRRGSAGESVHGENPAMLKQGRACTGPAEEHPSSHLPGSGTQVQPMEHRPRRSRNLDGGRAVGSDEPHFSALEGHLFDVGAGLEDQVGSIPKPVIVPP